jgi:hypothetical protein
MPNAGCSVGEAVSRPEEIAAPEPMSDAELAWWLSRLQPPSSHYMDDASAARLLGRLNAITAERDRLLGEVERLTREREEALAPWNDREDRWSAEIEAAHPIHSGSHKEYLQAMEMVGARHSKGALVDLVNWLLRRSATAYARGVEDAARVTRRTEIDAPNIAGTYDRLMAEQAEKLRDAVLAAIRALAPGGAT